MSCTYVYYNIFSSSREEKKQLKYDTKDQILIEKVKVKEIIFIYSNTFLIN